MIDIQLCTNKEQWNDVLLDHDAHPLQLWGWGQVKAGHGWKAERYFGYDDDRLVMAAQVLVRPLPFPFQSFAYVPRGPVVVEGEYSEEFLKELAEIVKKKHRSVALSVEPNSREMIAPKGWSTSKNHVLQSETVLLDLERSESDLLSDMAKKTRQYIRKSAADGIEIRQVRRKEDVAACLELYEQTSKRAGFNLHDRQYYIDILQQMEDHSPIFAAYLDGRPIAFLWLAVSGAVAYELYGGMNDDGQRLRANYALKWHAIRKAKEWGLSQYDFGGLVAGGVSVFKQGWAQDATVFAGTFDKPLSPLYGLWTKGLPAAKKLSQTLRRR